METTRHVGTSLPIEWRSTSSFVAAALLTLFGGAWTGVTLFAVYAFANGDDLFLEPIRFGILLTVFLLVGLVMLLAGVNGFFIRTSIRIDDSSVRFRDTGLYWSKGEWTEPLDAFRGVLPTYRLRDGGDRRRDYTQFEITLKHARDPNRDILLYRGKAENHRRGELAQREQAEGFARLLGVPLLTELEEGRLEARDADDLDKSIRERVEEGDVEVIPVDLSILPSDMKLQVRRTADGYVFRSRMRCLFWPGTLLAAGGLAHVYWYFGPGLPPGEGSEWVVPVVGTGFALFGAFLLFISLFRVDRLQVSPKGVRLGPSRPGVPLGDSDWFLAAWEIEEVIIQRNKYRRHQVVLTGDRQIVRWGQCLSRLERKVVRAAIIETLAQPSGRG